MSANGRKSIHQFLCSDALWSTFQRMAEDQEKGIDELIADALTAYAQLAGYQTGISIEEADEEGPATPPPVRRPIPAASGRPLAPPPPPPMPSAGSRYGRPIPAPGGGLNAMGMMQATPPPPPHVSADGTPGGTTAPPLYLVFDNQKYRIDKDQFIIGRGSKSSDLPIKDGNISRKHAAVIRRNGTYFIKDLGSTNGIDFKGMRIDNKRIDEGDLFHLCDYELRFTYKR
jgi:FHA domain